MFQDFLFIPTLAWYMKCGLCMHAQRNFDASTHDVSQSGIGCQATRGSLRDLSLTPGQRVKGTETDAVKDTSLRAPTQMGGWVWTR